MATRRIFLSGTTAALTLPATSYARIPGSNDRIGLGVIGYGLIGKRHVQTFRGLEGCEIRGIGDAHRPRIEEGVRAAGDSCRGFADFRKMLDEKSIQAVVVATPDHWHALMTMMACAAGKDVYVEKPMTLFAKEGEWMQAVAKRTKRVFQLGTQQRSGPHYEQARTLVRNGHIGTITTVRISQSRNIHPGFAKLPGGDPPDGFDWDLWLGPAPQRPFNPNRGLYHFRWFWDTSGGQMTNLTSHELDIVDWILGLESLTQVTSIGGRLALRDNGETPDTQDSLFKLKDYTISTSLRECCKGKPMTRLEFFGTKGSLSLSRTGFTVTADPMEPPESKIPGIVTGHPAGGPRLPGPVGVKRDLTQALEDRTGNADDQYLRHARNFLDCIRTRAQPVSDLASGHRVSTACHLANLSLRLGRSLTWDAKSGRTADAEANAQLVRTYRSPWDRELNALNVM